MRGKLQRNRERMTVRGLSNNHNHNLKNLFKGAAISASIRPGPLHDFYVALLEKGIRPSKGTFRRSGSLSFQRQAHGAPVDGQALGETERIHAQASVQR